MSNIEHLRLSQRALRTRPFYVMEIAKYAAQVAQSHPESAMLYLNIGEPDFPMLPRVQAAALDALNKGHLAYTPAAGIMPLREAISGWYSVRFGLDIGPERILVTAGASAALLLASLALFEAGDEVLMSDPSYPCNQQFVAMAGAQSILVPCGSEDRFQMSAAKVRACWTPQSRGLILASPSNPTGTAIAPQVLREVLEGVRAQNGVVIADEIYLGLGFGAAPLQSALALGEDIVSINSFSKYFAMTGWRLGWIVAPPQMVASLEILAQHLFICPSTLAQEAALACFHPDSLAECEARRAELQARRDRLLPQLEALGFQVPVVPDGAFYIWANAQQFAQRLGYANTWDLSKGLIDRAQVVLTPGRDFGCHETEDYLRISLAGSLHVLEEAMERLAALG